ncbi:MAG: GH25 family lysozyme [Massiliimalia sp.]|jgi:lysozyme
MIQHKAFRFAAFFGCLILSAGIIWAFLVFHGIILLNQPSEKEYPVRGVDLSSYQGTVDWEILASQNIDFAFFKATEGSSFVDPRFAYNYSQAPKQGISVGVYHFFSYDSKGIDQAEHYISTVVPFEGMLPPVIDVEFYGDKEKYPPDREDVSRELKHMLSALEEFYGLKPIIYATEKSYDYYLAGDYEEYDIWIRNVISKPHLSDGRQWIFWQYTNREKLDGYKGKEPFIDMNVFAGSEEVFLSYPRFSVQ